MPAGDARPVPRKNTAFRLYFAVRNSTTGALITSWTGADSEVSLDGGSFADCTNEATEIGTSGCGFIDLTSSEMNADAVVYKLTLTNSNALPLVLTLFPEEAGDYRGETTAFSSTASTAVNAIKTSTDNLATAMELDGAVYRFTVNALEQAPTGGGGGSTDWTADERTAIRAILGIPTSGTTPSDPTTGILDTIRDLVVVVDAVADAIEVDTQDIQSRLPAALVSGRMDSSVGAMASNVITASSIASSAFDDKGNWLKPTVAGRTLDVTATGAAGIDWGNVENQSAIVALSNTDIQLAESVDVVGAVTSLSSGAIAASTFAADSITSTALAASAANEIRDSVWNATLSSYTTAGTAGLGLSDILSRVTATVKTMWDNLVAMITGSGASAKYTVTALSNAPSGGGGGGGDPWATDIATGYSGTQAGAILNNINSKAELITSDTVYLSSDASNGTNITVYKDEVRTVTVPVDENLTTKTLRFVVEDFQGVDVFAVADASITKTSTTFSFATTSALTGEVAEYDWSLRDITSGINRIVSKGVLSVKPAAELDA